MQHIDTGNIFTGTARLYGLLPRDFFCFVVFLLDLLLGFCLRDPPDYCDSWQEIRDKHVRILAILAIYLDHILS